MKKLFRNFMTYLRKHISSSLGIIISAAVLVELINVVQFYYTRDLLRTEIEQRAQTELMAKADMIAHTLHTAEATMEEHCRHIQQHLQNPDDMFTATKQLRSIQTWWADASALCPIIIRRRGASSNLMLKNETDRWW